MTALVPTVYGDAPGKKLAHDVLVAITVLADSVNDDQRRAGDTGVGEPTLPVKGESVVAIKGKTGGRGIHRGDFATESLGCQYFPTRGDVAGVCDPRGQAGTRRASGVPRQRPHLGV